MHTIWIVPGRFGLTFGPQQTGVSTKTSAVKRVKSILRKTYKLFVIWHQRSRQRYHLSKLDDDLLNDVGLNREAQRFEVSKVFWKK